jgi:hypothetical protein
MKPVRATTEEKVAYMSQQPRPVNPLWGWVVVQGQRLAVEDCNEPENDIRYEVIAPNHFHFGAGEYVHTKLCANLREVERCKGYGLEACDHTCGGL